LLVIPVVYYDHARISFEGFPNMPANKTPVLGLVVPCMNEEEVLPQTAEALKSKFESLAQRNLIGKGSKIVFVDDGSTDGTWATICKLVESDECFEGIKLTRNFGHQFAVYAGLMHAQGDALISMDADLQDDINAIDEMVEQYIAGNEVVYGVRADRHSDKIFKRWTAALHYWISARFGVVTIPHHADFRLLSRRAVSILSQYRETNLYLRGVVPLLGLQSSEVHYMRSRRLAGKTKYRLRDMLGLSVQGITSFSIVPLRVISLLGLFVFLVSTGFGLWALYASWVGLTTPIQGWAPTGIPIYLLGGLQILAIGVVGEYIGKTYMEVKSRPTYTIEKTALHESDSGDSS
jgi:glycosyltransferase involved in cell wall biosynthesis